MGFPSTSTSVLRPDLGLRVQEFSPAADHREFISFPLTAPVVVSRASGQFSKIPIEQLLQKRETKRAPGGGYGRGHWQFQVANYTCTEHGAEEPLDDREAAMYADLIDGEQISVGRAADAVKRDYEMEVAELLFSATTFADYTSGVTHEWDDATNATPIVNVETAVQSIYEASGVWPNAIVINRKVFRNLRNCEAIIERISSSGAGSPTKPSDITSRMIAQCLGLDFCLVGGASKNTADEGQDVAIAPIWSDEYALICKIATGPDPAEPATARSFFWSEEAGDRENQFLIVESYREENRRGEVFRARCSWDVQLLHAQTAHLLSNITTSE